MVQSLDHIQTDAGQAGKPIPSEYLAAAFYEFVKKERENIPDGVVRAIRDLAPDGKGGVDSIELEVPGKGSVRLTKETRAAANKELKRRKKAG